MMAAARSARAVVPTYCSDLRDASSLLIALTLRLTVGTVNYKKTVPTVRRAGVAQIVVARLRAAVFSSCGAKGTMIDVIAFDADDTLWHNERLFSLTQEKFRELL